jgi:ribosomal protein S18 acetylase RimI-like enzyme
MRLREATGRDRAAVLALGVAEEAAWFGQADIGTEEVGEWIDEEGGVACGVVAVDDAGDVRGFASPGRHQTVFLADPAVTDAVADELLAWLHEQRSVVQVITSPSDAARVRAFERHGLRHSRSSFMLARPDSAGSLPAAAPPDGVHVAPYRLGDADAAIHRLIYVDAAWASVEGHAERDLDAWRKTVLPCRSLFVAWRDRRPVGWVAGRMSDSGRGHVSWLAVATAERGRGLGRALLVHAFSDLQVAGARGLTLEVEADNDAALGLYRSIGMQIEREWQTFTTGS